MAMNDRLSKLESLIQSSLQEQSEATWLDSKEFSKYAHISQQALRYAMEKGVLHGDAIRNIGTPKRPRYRFHRNKALDQYMNREHSTNFRNG